MYKYSHRKTMHTDKCQWIAAAATGSHTSMFGIRMCSDLLLKTATQALQPLDCELQFLNLGVLCITVFYRACQQPCCLGVFLGQIAVQLSQFLQGGPVKVGQVMPCRRKTGEARPLNRTFLSSLSCTLVVWHDFMASDAFCIASCSSRTRWA